MMNVVFFSLIAIAVLSGAWQGKMHEVSEASVTAAKAAVELVVGLIGQMALWLGFVRILQDGGLMNSLARALKPIMHRLFPDVPAQHPAMGAMILNLSANVLGLGNAATPFGLKAMVELNRLNKRAGVATDAMALFLVINTSGLAVLPLGVVAMRASLGSKDAAGIVIPSIIATFISTVIAVIIGRWLANRKQFSLEQFPLDVSPDVTSASHTQTERNAEEEAQLDADIKALQADSRGNIPTSWQHRLGVYAAYAIALVFVGLGVRTAMADPDPWASAKTIFSDWMMPAIMLFILLYGAARRVSLYQSFIAGAKEAFQLAVGIIPFLVAILAAIGMFRASGSMDVAIRMLKPVLEPIGLPAESLPMILIRPLSGSGALATMTDILKTSGPDTFVGYFVSVVSGSTETTFYVLAVYYGAVGIKAIRHTLWACLLADTVGIFISLLICRWFF